MEGQRDREREREHEPESPAERIEPEDAKPADDAPSDRDLRPASDTDRVIEEKGRERENG